MHKTFPALLLCTGLASYVIGCAPAAPPTEVEPPGTDEVSPDLDTVSPTLAIHSPREDLAILARRVRVEGHAADDAGEVELELRVGDAAPIPVPVNAEGTYAVDFTPQPGTNTFTLIARDAAGNRTEQTRHVYYGHRVSAGSSQTVALLEGAVVTWGRNEVGQIGDGTLTSTLQYASAKYRHEGLSDVVSVVSRAGFMLALHADGTMSSWGSNARMQLGYVADSNDCGIGADEPCNRVPRIIPGITDAVAMAAGTSFTLVLREDGTVLAFGANDAGQLGDGASTADRMEPAPVEGLQDVLQVAAAAETAYALTADGRVWAWGSNALGQLGMGPPDDAAHPVPQVVPELSGAVAVAGAMNAGYALLGDGSVRAWGDNERAELGNGTGRTATSPTPVLTLNAEGDATVPLTGIVSVVADGYTAFALTSGGRVYAWGLGQFGELGMGVRENGDLDQNPRPFATLVPVADADLPHFDVVEVETGTVGATIVRTTEQNLFAWGWSVQGCFGVHGLREMWPYTSPQLIHSHE